MYVLTYVYGFMLVTQLFGKIQLLLYVYGFMLVTQLFGKIQLLLSNKIEIGKLAGGLTFLE